MVCTKNKLLQENQMLFVGNTIHAKVTAVLASKTECCCLFGNTVRELNGEVLGVEVRPTAKGWQMKYIHAKFKVGSKTKNVTLPLSQVIAGELPCYPRSANQTKSNGGQRTMAMFVTPQCKPKPITAVTPLAETKYAPPMQMTPPSPPSPTSESDDNVPFIKLLNKKPKASKAACHPLYDK